MSWKRLSPAAILLLLPAPAVLAQSNFESPKLAPGVVTQGSGMESPKIAASVVVQGSGLGSSKLSVGIVVAPPGLESSKLSAGIVVQTLPGVAGTIPRAPLTHW
ncbi:MAG: hypothetical protein JSS04_12200 [Proteobacteria bacterium]|nr:hypothetical protein [Pseudomonadota bacterium]